MKKRNIHKDCWDEESVKMAIILGLFAGAGIHLILWKVVPFLWEECGIIPFVAVLGLCMGWSLKGEMKEG